MEVSDTFSTDCFELTFFRMKIYCQSASIDTGFLSIDWIFTCSKNRHLFNMLKGGFFNLSLNKWL